MSTTPTVRVEDIEVFADDLDIRRAASIYKEHGCLVVRDLMKGYLKEIHRDIEAAAAKTIELMEKAEKIPEGWKTPNGSLLIPAPPNFERDKQIMVLPLSYQTSATFFHSAFDPKTLDIVEAVLGPNIELYGTGQCLYKEPVGGHPKHLHQDSAYFEHRFEGPVATLNYVVDTDLVNGALHVVPGSFKMKTLKHVDTFSHLGLQEEEWLWERALPVVGEAGDSIFFHVDTIHGSKQNHSESPRPVFIHRYRRADDYVIVQATTAEKRAEAEKRVEEASKEIQRGFMVRGFRDYAEEHGC